MYSYIRILCMHCMFYWTRSKKNNGENHMSYFPDKDPDWGKITPESSFFIRGAGSNVVWIEPENDLVRADYASILGDLSDGSDFFSKLRYSSTGLPQWIHLIASLRICPLQDGHSIIWLILTPTIELKTLNIYLCSFTCRYLEAFLSTCTHQSQKGSPPGRASETSQGEERR